MKEEENTVAYWKARAEKAEVDLLWMDRQFTQHRLSADQASARRSADVGALQARLTAAEARVAELTKKLTECLRK